MIKAQSAESRSKQDRDLKSSSDLEKEDRKDERVKKQAVEQSKLLSQRKGERGELSDDSGNITSEILS